EREREKTRKEKLKCVAFLHCLHAFVSRSVNVLFCFFCSFFPSFFSYFLVSFSSFFFLLSSIYLSIYLSIFISIYDNSLYDLLKDRPLTRQFELKIEGKRRTRKPEYLGAESAHWGNLVFML